MGGKEGRGRGKGEGKEEKGGRGGRWRLRGMEG